MEMCRKTAVATFLAGALLVFSACATPPVSGRNDSSTTVSVQEATQAFVDAVYLYCIQSIETEKPLDEISVTNATPIERAVKGESILGRKVGETPTWKMVGGNVKIENHIGKRCTVSSFGLPVKGTYDIIGMAISQPSYGYNMEEDRSAPPYIVRHNYTKDQEGYRYTIRLMGNEPGAPGTLSRFSTVLAYVYKAEIEQDSEPE